MGSARTTVAYLIHDRYRAEYEGVFGAMPSLRDAQGAALFDVTAKPGSASWAAMSPSDQHAITQIYVNFGKAVAAYERRIVARGGRFDAFTAEIKSAEDSDALSPSEKAGLKVFIGKGKCLDCHHGPTLSDWRFHCIAVSGHGPNVSTEDPGRGPAINKVRNDEFNCASSWSDANDKAACAVNTVVEKLRDHGSFRTPGLRNIAQTAPYMHTGMAGTLEDVIELYDQGGDSGGYVGATELVPLGLTAEEKADLVAFMRALDADPLPAQLVTAPVLP
jgi:cytochrome c peroxidase